jgi:hypothetical protein
MIKKGKVCALDQLLLERFGGKVVRGPDVQLSRRRNLPDVWNLYLPRSSRTAMDTVDRRQTKRGGGNGTA